MAVPPIALLATGVGLASSVAQAQAQNKSLKQTKKTNAAIAKVNADRRREQISREFGKISGALRVSAGERGSAQSRSSAALALSSFSEAASANADIALDEYLNINRSVGTYSNVFSSGLLGGLQGLQAGFALDSGLEDLNATSS